MQHQRATMLPMLFQAIAVVVAVATYATISFNSIFTVYLVALAPFASPWLFPCLASAAALAVIVAPVLEREPETIYLVGQAGIVLLLAVIGRLTRLPKKGGPANRVIALTLPGIRLMFIATLALLLAWLALFRSAPVVRIGAWAATLAAFLFGASWPGSIQPIRWRSGLANAALLLASTALSLAALEVAARLLLDPPGIQQPGVGAFQTDPKTFWTLKPNHEGVYSTTPVEGAPQSFVLATSSQGIRDRELPSKQAGEFRIAMLGDSMVMGWGVAADETLPAALERALRDMELNRHIVVMNLGVAGFGPWQQRFFFLDRGLPLEPDLTIIAIYPDNDVQDTLARTGEYLESYNSEWDEVVAFHRHRADWHVQAEWWFRDKSRLYYQAKRLIGPGLDLNVLLRDVRFLEPSRRPLPPPSKDRPFSLEFFLDEWYPSLEHGWSSLESDVLELRRDCDARGIGFAAICLPLWIAMNDEAWRRTTALAGPRLHYERFKDTRVCEAFFERAGIPYINVSGPMRERARHEPMYLSDGHLSPQGNRFIADVLANFLVEEVLPGQGVERIAAPEQN